MNLSSADCLDLWERGLRLHPLDRGLLLLGAALPETPSETLADWPLGRRNRALAELQCVSFGRKLEGQLSCPHCGEELEFQMDGRTLFKTDAATAAPEAGGEGAPVVVQGQSFRLPSTRDLAWAARETDPRLAAILLAKSCLKGRAEVIAWSDQDLEEIGERMAVADPMAEVRLAFECARCGHHWEESLDILVFLWRGIEGRAKRLLAEVHTLATAYGWAEKEILALSEPRRRLYLDMVRA